MKIENWNWSGLVVQNQACIKKQQHFVQGEKNLIRRSNQNLQHADIKVHDNMNNKCSLNEQSYVVT
jgi:hypothetical protein